MNEREKLEGQLEKLKELTDLTEKMVAYLKVLEAVVAVSNIKGIDDPADFMERSKNFRNIDEALLWKNIEDGMLRNIDNASEAQLMEIVSGRKFRFKYYPEIHKSIENPEFIKL
jgi:hypothetical protein